MSRQYMKEMRESLGYSATWLPHTPLELGDIGVMEAHGYRRVARAADYQIALTRREGAGQAVITHQSAGGVRVRVRTAAEGAALRMPVSRGLVQC